MSKLLAWTPVTESNGPLIFSVLIHPDQELDPHMYLSLLSDRVQEMLDRTEDREGAVARLQELLEAGGLWPGPMTTEEGSEANTLVWSNPNMLGRLYELGLPENLAIMKPMEILAARDQIESDEADPVGRLQSWASAVGTMR